MERYYYFKTFIVDHFNGSFVEQIFSVLILLIVLIFLIAGYIYSSMSWQKIAGWYKDYNYSWLAWIPFGRSAMILHLADIGWGWIFLVLIPVLGWIALWILMTISMWKIFDTQGYRGWLSFAYFFRNILDRTLAIGTIFYFVVIGIVAWGKPDKSKKKSKEIDKTA